MDLCNVIDKTVAFLRAQAKFLESVKLAAKPDDFALANPDPQPPKPLENGAAIEAEFEEWWPHYPRREDKGHARKAFASACKKTTLVVLIAAAQSYAAEDRARKYIALPATWLNGERWLQYTVDAPGEEISEADAALMLWRTVVKAYVERGKKHWPEAHGIAPGMPGCQVPQSVLTEYGLATLL